MTLVRSAPRSLPPTRVSGSGPGERLQRRQARRRLLREELLAVAILVIALAVTLVVLGMQWLGGATSTSGSASYTPTYILGGSA